MRKKDDDGRSPKPRESASLSPPPEAPRSMAARTPRWSKSISELAAAKRLATSAQPAAVMVMPARNGASARQPSPTEAASEAPPLKPTRGVLPKSPREPIAARLRARRGRVAVELRRGIPCWLTSMLVHLLAVVVLGSLVARPAARRYLGAIVASFSNVDEAPVEMTILHVNIPRDEGTIEGNQTRQLLDDDKDPFADQAKQPPPQLPAVASPIPIPQASQGLAQQNQTAQQPSDAVVAAPGQSGDQMSADALPIERPQGDPALRAQSAADQRRLDDIVDRFIEFDVGRLPGEAGMQAKRDFDALGPEAIAALVRGLNKAAYIRASCPVMMISRKLQSALEANRDRSLLDYAVENIGRDVPASAPYAAQVRAMREHWTAIATGRSTSRDVLSLARELVHTKAQRRLEATLAVIDEQERFNDADRKELGWLLAGQLKSRDVKLRDAAWQALVTLSGGEDFGPAGKSRAGEVQNAVCQWYRHFDAERFDARARGLLDSAKDFEKRKQRGAAMRLYRRVMIEYAGSEAAKEATSQLDGFKPAKTAKPR